MIGAPRQRSTIDPEGVLAVARRWRSQVACVKMRSVEGREKLWIFGYGSLVWRPAFAYEERRPATISGWERRFYQGSTDHRGVPGAPGRVATLVAAPGSRCAGMVYAVAPTDAKAVLERLDVREQGGYERRRIAAVTESTKSTTIDALVYLATADNPDYLGPAPIEVMAEQILCAHGPSGANTEYLLRLGGWLREIGAEDRHVFDLERVVRSRLSEAS